MNLTSTSLRFPAAVAVAAALVVLFGVLAVISRPIQLLPVLDRPQITVFNNWREAAPAEMESYIIEPQENVLRRTPGVVELSSNISRGFGMITLTFEVGTDMQQALINVINNLNTAPPRPADAGEPFVASGSGGMNTPNAATIQIYPAPDNPDKNINAERYQRVIDDVVEPRLNRITGVARVNMASRRPFEVRITFDPYRAAALGVTLGQISGALSQADDVSGGFADVGRRQYTVRFEGQPSLENIADTIVAWNGERPVHLREIAEVEKRQVDPFGVNMRNGYPAYYIALERTNDSNTVEILDQVNVAIDELNAGAVGQAGLVIELSFDASVYIRRAISLVQNNLGLGVLLTLGVLFFFLRSGRAVFIIASSIPLSLLVAFIALQVFNLSLNVISLAGLAFAVGLVLDAAIIVQENIVRYRQAGENRDIAVKKGADQVRGALFASTITTVAIFLPILFLEGQEGQMFADLALTLSVAVLASMVAALTLVPLCSRRWLRGIGGPDPQQHWWESLTNGVMRITDGPRLRAFWIVGLLTLCAGLVVVLKPKADFLPSAQADAVNVFFNVPPGVNNAVFEREIAGEIAERLRPHMEHREEPYIRGYNIGFYGAFNVLYLYPLNAGEVDDFLELLRGDLLRGIPDTQAFVTRASLLGIDFNGGRTISVDLQGSDIAGLMTAARTGIGVIRELIPEAVVRPVPGLHMAEPELRIQPDERRITDAGLNTRDVGTAVRAMTGGLFVGEYFDGNDRYDMILRAGAWQNPEELGAMPIATPRAGPQTLGSLARFERTVGPTQLRRFDGQRTISLQVLPPERMTVEEALDVLRDGAGPRLAEALPAGATIKYRGSADRLEEALGNMFANFLLAVVILFLVMAAILKSVRDSLLVLLIMPLALAGGIVSLRLLNLVTYQSLDMLTMIGFVILLGLVVNNGILLVSQTRDGERGGLSRTDAVRQAVRFRARPIYMSTLTSIFGMLPLMLIPGVGSDIYRGLATVIVGGMVFSALFTLILMPSLLRLGEAGGLLDRLPLGRRVFGGSPRHETS